jgi:uncharacterized delta-60 repeat protein
MPLNSFIRFSILVLSSLIVSTAFGQCPPVSEGNLPETKMIKNVITPTIKEPNPAEKLDTNGKIRIDKTKKQPVNPDSTAPIPAKKPEREKQINTVVSKNVGFNGPLTIQVPGVASSSKIIQQDGRIIIVGGSDIFNGEEVEQGIFLTRLEKDGTPDPSFGNYGSVLINLYTKNKISNNTSPSIALSPTGKIIITRTLTDKFPGNIPGTLVAVVRMDQNGTLDPTFGNGGIVLTTIKDKFEANSVAVQRDEKIVVGGSARGIDRKNNITCATLVRYQYNGQLDNTFGTAGVESVVLNIGQPATPSRESSFSSIFIQENGLIVAVGRIYPAWFERDQSSKMLIMEFLPTGEPNPAFGKAGTTMLTFDAPFQSFSAESVMVRENGKILVGGIAELWKGDAGQSSIYDVAFAFVQLRQSGELDATFGKAGKVIANITPRIAVNTSEQPLNYLRKVMLDPSGDIYAVGYAHGRLGTTERAINIVALNSNGSLKRNFGNKGLYSSINTFTPWRLDFGFDALLTSDGRLVISGSHWKITEHSGFEDAIALWAFSINPGPTGCPFPIMKKERMK